MPLNSDPKDVLFCVFPTPFATLTVLDDPP